MPDNNEIDKLFPEILWINPGWRAWERDLNIGNSKRVKYVRGDVAEDEYTRGYNDGRISDSREKIENLTEVSVPRIAPEVKKNVIENFSKLKPGHIEFIGCYGGWQTIDTAPKDKRVAIWIWNKSYSIPQAAWSNTWWSCGFSNGDKPTHWMPRQDTPDPPRIEGNGLRMLFFEDWADSPTNEKQVMDLIAESLKDAITGIEWWVNEYPNDDNRADEEKIQEWKDRITEYEKLGRLK